MQTFGYGHLAAGFGFGGIIRICIDRRGGAPPKSQNRRWRLVADRYQFGIQTCSWKFCNEELKEKMLHLVVVRSQISPNRRLSPICFNPCFGNSELVRDFVTRFMGIISKPGSVFEKWTCSTIFDQIWLKTVFAIETIEVVSKGASFCGKLMENLAPPSGG